MVTFLARPVLLLSFWQVPVTLIARVLDRVRLEDHFIGKSSSHILEESSLSHTSQVTLIAVSWIESSYQARVTLHR